jgi:transketolase
MELAHMAYTDFTEFLRRNPEDFLRSDRDRFVLSD